MVVAICVLYSPSFAMPADEMTRPLSFAGTLDDEGSPYEGELDVTFALYDHPTEVQTLNILWQEIVPVMFVDGHFVVLLG